MASKWNRNGGVCSAFGCSKRRGTNLLSGVKMFSFPKNPDQRAAWTNAVMRENWTPTKNSLLCNAHFISGKPSQDRQHPDYVPSQFSFTNKPIEQGQKNIKRYERRIKRIRNDSETTSFSYDASEEADEDMDSSLDVSPSSRNNINAAALQTDLTAKDTVILENSSSFENVSSTSPLQRKKRIPADPQSLAEWGQSREITNNQTNQNVLTHQLIHLVKKLRAEVAQVNEKLDTLLEGDRPSDGSSIAVLPPDVELPLELEEDLIDLNARLETDKGLSPIMVKFLYDAGYGKTPNSFIHHITKKVLSQGLAKKYSRCGKRGKKSFLPFTNVLNVILAAAAKRFPRQEKHSLMECFGKSLANAPDWYGRTKQDTMEDVII